MTDFFNFRGFSPSPEIVFNAEAMLGQLMSLSSGVTDTSALLTQVETQYVCTIEIRTKLTSFSEKISAIDPLEAINMIDQKIRGQILRWHSSQKNEAFEMGESASPFERQELGSVTK